MLVSVMKSTDGKIRVYLYDDQTAEVSNERGTVLYGRQQLYKIAARLADLGVSSEDLIPD